MIANQRSKVRVNTARVVNGWYLLPKLKLKQQQWKSVCEKSLSFIYFKDLKADKIVKLCFIILCCQEGWVNKLYVAPIWWVTHEKLRVEPNAETDSSSTSNVTLLLKVEKVENVFFCFL